MDQNETENIPNAGTPEIPVNHEINTPDSVFDSVAVETQTTVEAQAQPETSIAADSVQPHQDKPFLRKRAVSEGIYGDVRGLAVKVLTRVERTDSYLDKLIDSEIRADGLNDYDKSLLNEICHGVMRWFRRLDWFLNGFYRGQYEKCVPEIKNALRVALYQILFLNKIPDYAAVNEAVEFVKRFSTQRHGDVVNGLLRTIIRTKNDLVYPTREIDEVKYLGIMQSHPNWMVRRWIQRFGFEEAEKLAEANNKRPILTLRINKMKVNRDEFIRKFSDRSLSYRFCRYIDYFVTLRLMSKIYLDEDFLEGNFAIQDESAGFPSILLAPHQDEIVLDMC